MKSYFNYQLFNKRKNKIKTDIFIRPIVTRGYKIKICIIRRSYHEIKRRHCKYDAFIYPITQQSRKIFLLRRINEPYVSIQSCGSTIKNTINDSFDKIYDINIPSFLKKLHINQLNNRAITNLAETIFKEIHEMKDKINEIKTNLDDSIFCVDNINEELFKALDSEIPNLTVSENTFKFLLEQMENPQPPNDNLVAAVRNYKQNMNSDNSFEIKEIFIPRNDKTKH